MTNRINYKTRRAIVNAIINETKDHGDAIRPLNCERWDDITFSFAPTVKITRKGLGLIARRMSEATLQLEYTKAGA